MENWDETSETEGVKCQWKCEAQAADVWIFSNGKPSIVYGSMKKPELIPPNDFDHLVVKKDWERLCVWSMECVEWKRGKLI